MSEVIVALDYPSPEPARSLVDRLPEGTWYKVGLELFTAAGPDFVRRMADRGHPVFLDLKLHDIPNTVAGAVRSAAGLGAGLITVHAAGGKEMVAAAAEEAGAADDLRVLAVTVLTSLGEEDVASVLGEGADVGETVLRLARVARDAGADGAVASVAECRRLKTALGRGFRVATPGIRLPGDFAHDQRRVATPEDAAAAGADYLVVGRSITRARDPAAALRAVKESAGGSGSGAGGA